jgi:uncharacterized protein
MQLSQDRPEGYLFFRSCAPGRVRVVDRELTRSFVLAPDRLVEDWAPASAAALDPAAFEPVLALEPELVLLGTGERQVFPPRAVQAALLARRVGLEAMANAAACRTYNLLAGEGRRVVAAIILERAGPG